MISYLDIADAYSRGDWSKAINAYWSPLYSWILGVVMSVLRPSSYWELPVVQLVNFGIYLFALICFNSFWFELIRYRKSLIAEFSEDASECLPEWAWLALGYTLFIWSSLSLITMREASPDMCVAAFVYLAAAVLLRIRLASSKLPIFGLLGVVLGLGYFAKAAVFPLAFIFLGVSLFFGGGIRKSLPFALFAFLLFSVVASPFLMAISKAKGRPTFGDSGKLNYSWYVNATTRWIHWQGEGRGCGTPIHPTRKLLDRPAIYEFENPVGGTYPPWYDPSYWYEGVVLHFDLNEQISVLGKSIKTFCKLLIRSQGIPAVAFLLLLLTGRISWLRTRGGIEYQSFFILSIAGLGMFSLVHVEGRYIAAFVVLFWAGVLSGMQLKESRISRRLVLCLTIVMLTCMGLDVIASTAREVDRLTQNEGPDLQWQLATHLQHLGLREGDSVAYIGRAFPAYWARLSRVRIVAEIPYDQKDSFWKADILVKSQVMDVFERIGARLVVAEKPPPNITMNGWQQLGNTDYYAYVSLKNGTPGFP